MKKTLAIIPLFFLSLAGCRPLWVNTVSPSGPPEYRLGWEDGCDTSFSAEEGSWTYKEMYGFKKRPEMSTNEQYKQGWTEGFTYCRFSYAASKNYEFPINIGWGEGIDVWGGSSAVWGK